MRRVAKCSCAHWPSSDARGGQMECVPTIDIEIIKYLLNIGITEDSTLSNINGNVLSVSFMERGSGYPPNYLKVF